MTPCEDMWKLTGSTFGLKLLIEYLLFSGRLHPKLKLAWRISTMLFLICYVASTRAASVLVLARVTTPSFNIAVVFMSLMWPPRYILFPLVFSTRALFSAYELDLFYSPLNDPCCSVSYEEGKTPSFKLDLTGSCLFVPTSVPLAHYLSIN